MLTLGSLDLLFQLLAVGVLGVAINKVADRQKGEHSEPPYSFVGELPSHRSTCSEGAGRARRWRLPFDTVTA